MQWDKVKNVLIVILAAVNLFLLGNLGARLWQNMQWEAELDSSLRTLAQGYGLTLDEDFKLPDDKELPELSVDRSRQDEEAVAAAALGDEMERAEREDGTVIFESSRCSTVRYLSGLTRKTMWRCLACGASAYRIQQSAGAGFPAMRRMRCWNLSQDVRRRKPCCPWRWATVCSWTAAGACNLHQLGRSSPIRVNIWWIVTKRRS